MLRRRSAGRGVGGDDAAQVCDSAVEVLLVDRDVGARNQRVLANRAVGAGALEQEVRAPIVALRAVDLPERHEGVGVRRIERQRFL